MPSTNYKPSKELSRDFIETVREKPGVRASELAAALSVNESTISVAGRMLVKRGRVIRKRKGRAFAYYIPEERQAVPADIVELAEIDAIREELESLRAEVEDLRAFKKCAVAQYPDLAVDPIVLEAREIVAELYPSERDKVLSGERDGGPDMCVAVATLRRARGAK
jgi:DNA-binding transcriptional MocR family regulator